VLYRQGDIHLIVNAQPDSFARERFDAHGTSVCALGLRCADPLAAVSRATAMRSQRHDSPVGPNELRVPATVAPGGNLVHFVPQALGATACTPPTSSSKKKKKTKAPARPMPTTGLQAIDHVALGLALDQLDTWVLFSRAVLGLEPGESLELADPFGLIRSRGVANADRSLRLVLNVSLSQRTRTARTLQREGGGAVHHIALAAKTSSKRSQAARQRHAPSCRFRTTTTTTWPRASTSTAGCSNACAPPACCSTARPRRLPPHLYRELRGGTVLRGCAARRRLRRVRCPQRAGAHGIPGAGIDKRFFRHHLETTMSQHPQQPKSRKAGTSRRRPPPAAGSARRWSTTTSSSTPPRRR
jgi:hypothetical protein